MTFLYSYKTSDGIRHENRIRAKSREQVFELLRQEGIRPIKVTQKGADVVRIVQLLVCGAFIGVLAFKLLTFVSPPSAVSEAQVKCPNELVEKVESALVQFRETISNYETEESRFQSKEELSPVLQRVRQAGEVVDYYRIFLHGIFGSVSSAADGSDDASVAIRRYYGETMSELDVADERFKSREYVLTLLRDNWGAWRYEHSEKGYRIVFISPDLQREYDFHLSGADAASLRWRRDFGTAQRTGERR